MKTLPGSLALLFLVVAQSVYAIPLTMQSAYSFRSDRTANPLGLPATSIVVGANGVTPNSLAGDFGELTTVTASQGSFEIALNKINAAPNSPFYNSYIVSAPYDPNLTGQWTVTAANPESDGGLSPQIQTIAFGDVAAVPFVSSMRLSGAGTEIQLNWTQPADDSRVERQTVFVFQQQPGGGYLNIHAAELDAAARSFDLQTIPGLAIGSNYVVSIDTSDLINNATVASSASYFSFTPTVEAINAFLPSTSEPGLYNFNVGIQSPDEIIFLDPVVAIGYEFAIGAGDPNFASVVLPDIGDGIFELWLFDDLLGDAFFVDTLTAGTTYHFAEGGVDAFQILGIEISAMLDPLDALAFQAGVQFTNAGLFTGTMAAITFDTDALSVPEPGTVLLLFSGLGGLLATRRRRLAA